MNYDEIYKIIHRAYCQCSDEKLKEDLDTALDVLATIEFLRAAY